MLEDLFPKGRWVCLFVESRKLIQERKVGLWQVLPKSQQFLPNNEWPIGHATARSQFLTPRRFPILILEVCNQTRPEAVRTIPIKS